MQRVGGTLWCSWKLYIRAALSMGLASVVLGVLVLVGGGCKAEGGGGPPSTPTASPQRVLERTSAHLASLRTVAFSLKHDGGATVLFPGVEMRGLEGRAALPNRVQIEVDASAVSMQAVFEVSVVVVGDQAFITDPLTASWRRVPSESLPLNFRDLGRTLAAIVDSVQQPRFVEDKGEGAWRVAGKVSSESLRALLPGAARGLTVDLLLDLDDDARLRRARIAGRILPDDQAEVVRVLTLHSFDEPVEIAPPESVP